MAPKTGPVPMIRRVRLKNFRSIADCDVELGPLTILVGPNGSGKSNFLHALDFLSDALNNGLETAVRRRGGMNSLLSRWALDDPDATLTIELELDLSEDRGGMYSLALHRTPSGDFTIAEEWCRVAVATRAGSFDEYVVGGTASRSGNGSASSGGADQQKSDKTLLLPHHAEHVSFGAVFRALAGMSVYSLNVAEMRKPHEPTGGDRLAPDGSNVASVLQRLAEQKGKRLPPAERILDWIQVLRPGIDAVRVAEVAGYLALQLVERPATDSRFGEPLPDDDPTWTFSSQEMSFGMLRWLGVLVALYQGRMRGGSPVTLVGIEEPEAAVHPGNATAVIEAMDEASLRTQVLATTHSASMLDYEDLDVGMLRGVSRVKGRTIIGPVDAASRQILEDGLSTAGELLRMRHLLPDEYADNQPTEVPATARA